MRIRSTLAASFLLAGAYFAMPGSAYAGDDDVLASLFAEKAEADADWDAWLAKLVDAVARDPNSPYALAAIRKIAGLQGSATNPRIVEEKLQPVLDAGVTDGEIDEALRGLLSARAAARGDLAAAEKLGPARGYLKRFATVGPLAWSDHVLVHRKFGPEAPVMDPNASWEGTHSQVKWTQLPEQASGMIDAGPYVRHAGSGVMYSVCRVKSPKAQNVAMKVSCSDSFKVIVNGREVVTADRERDFVPTRVWADVALVEGWNRVLVKVTGRSSFSVKFCDPATGMPVEGLEEGESIIAGAHPAAGPAPAARSYRTPTERAIAAGAGESADALRAAAAGFLAQGEDRMWDAFDAWKRAAAKEPRAGNVADANIQAGFGRVVSDFSPFPPVQRKLQAKQAFESALKAWKTHASASVRLAEFENQDDRPDKAVKALQALAKEAPSSSAFMGIARIASGRGWDREAIEAARAALERMPNDTDAIQFLADVDRRHGNFESLRKRHERLLEINRNDRGAANALVGHLRAQGRHEDALKLLGEYATRWPAEGGWRRQIADVQRALGREAEALAAYRDLAKEFPNDESLPRAIGEILEIQGDKAGAKAAYGESLGIESFQPALRRAITRIDGTDEDFGAGWEPDVADILAKLPSTEELKKLHPKASALTVLDHTVTRINADGTSSSYVHMIYKVLDEKGVEKYESLPNAGETLLVKATLPDGRVTTPSSLPGRPFNIEGLVPGTLLEQRFLVHQRSTARGYDGDKFMFQDTDIQDNPNPFLHSRLVVLSPEKMKLDPVARNYGGAPRVETKEGWTATIWEKRDMPRIDAEAHMPDTDEIIPHVDYSLPPKGGDTAWEVFGQRQDTRPTPYVEEALAQCVAGRMSDTEKVRAIHDWVNREITGDSGSASGPTAVLMDKSGNRAILMESMIRAAGVPCRIGRSMLWNGISAAANRGDAGADAFQWPFLWVEPADGGAPFPLFVFGQYAPFGVIPEECRDSPAVIADERGGEIRRLPGSTAPTDPDFRFTIKVGAKADDVTLSGGIVWNHPGSFNLKRQLLETAQDDRRKFAERQIAGFFATPKLTSYEMPNLDARGVPMELRLEGTMSTWLSQQGDVWVASLGLPPVGMGRRYVDRADRTYDLVIEDRDDRVDEFVVDLGDTFRVSSLPEDHIASHDVGTYSLTWRHEGRTIRVRREYHFHPVRYRADDYKRFVEWCKGIDDAEQQKIELRK